jgi:AraC-like DNA-binding protein
MPTSGWTFSRAAPTTTSTFRCRVADHAALAETAVVYRPDGEAVVTDWTAGTHLLAVKIERAAVEQTLSHDFLSPNEGEKSSIDVSAGRGRSWLELVRQLTTQLGDPNSVLQQPIAAMPFVECVLSGFLMIASPAYREALDQPAEPARPAAVRDATNIIDVEAHLPLTIAEIAGRCHVSVRTLQGGFRRHVGMTQMAYLRSVRLARAHAELCAADPARHTVSAIARRWGFTNLTRFANQHRTVFGEFPAATLRNASR